MLSFTEIAAMIGLFALRFGVPLAITGGLIYLLKRLDRRWEEEARLDEAARPRPAEQPAKETPAPRPTTRIPRPAATPPMPFVIPPGAGRGESRQQAQVGMGAPVTGGRKESRVQAQAGMGGPVAKRCWDVKGCSETRRATCAAAQHPEQPCWQAHLSSGGEVPEECVNCPVFQHSPLM